MTSRKKTPKNTTMNVYNESGKGYWMEGFGCIRAEGENRPSRPGHLVVLNDQGGSVMSVSDVAATLRAESHQHEPIICFEPGIVKREGSDSRFVEDMCGTLRADMGDNQPAVCYNAMFFSWANSPSMDMYASDVSQALRASPNGCPAVCYAIEGNTVDRASMKNGRGWCENVSPTLNTQDRHAVCFQLCGDRDNPSVSVSDQGGHVVLVYEGSSVTSPKNRNNPKPGDPCYALHTDSRNYVVIALEGNGARPSHMGNGYSDSDVMYTLNTIEQHSVCYNVDGRELTLKENQ